MIQHLAITPSYNFPRWADRILTVISVIVLVGYWVFVAPVKWIIFKCEGRKGK